MKARPFSLNINREKPDTRSAEAITNAALYAAANFLRRIDNITTADFEKGGERQEREALRKALKDCGL